MTRSMNDDALLHLRDSPSRYFIALDVFDFCPFKCLNSIRTLLRFYRRKFFDSAVLFPLVCHILFAYIYLRILYLLYYIEIPHPVKAPNYKHTPKQTAINVNIACRI